jgi:hypothetical protein
LVAVGDPVSIGNLRNVHSSVTQAAIFHFVSPLAS